MTIYAFVAIYIYTLTLPLLLVCTHAYDESEALRFVAMSGLTYCDSQQIKEKDSFHGDAVPELEIGSVWTNSSLLFYTGYDR
jgi:hypothetical protein